MKREYYQWLKDFKKLHNLKSINEAIYKLIEINKAWNEKMGTLIDSPKV